MPKALVVGIVLLMLLGLALRLPNVTWLHGTVWDYNFSATGAEDHHIKTAAAFGDSEKQYVTGTPTHIYVGKKVLEFITKQPPARSDYVLIARLVSLLYGVLTVGLVAVVAWSLTRSSLTALLAAAFFATAPLSILYSALGTADSAVTFYFLLTVFLSYLYMLERREVLFTLSMVGVGMCLALKFFVSTLVMPVLVLFSGDAKLNRALGALLAIAGSFSVASFFNFTPWDFQRFTYLVIYDNIQIVDSFSPIGNAFAYTRAFGAAVGLTGAAFFAAGLAAGVVKVAQNRSRFGSDRGSTLGKIAEILRHPLTVLSLPFVVQLGFVLRLGLHPTRHILFLLPVVAVIAGAGLAKGARSIGRNRLMTSLVIAVVLGYQMYNVLGIARLYENDIRLDMQKWAEENVGPHERIGSFSYYSGIEGFERLTNENISEVARRPDFIATCSSEYRRYLEKSDASEVYHAHGGQERLQFFNKLFEGRGSYRQIARFDREDYTLEQVLISRNVLGSIDIRVPDRCVIFRRLDGAT
jgi:hypothetical protein